MILNCVECFRLIDEDADPNRSWSDNGPICESCEEDAIEHYGNHQYDGVDFD